MDCQTAQEFSIEDLLAGRALSGEAEDHVRGCETCREELRGLTATWAALAALPLEEPSPGVGRRLGRRIRWEAAREAIGSVESWQRAALVGVAGFALSLALSWIVPYETMVELCRRLVEGSLPTAAAYVLAGLLYGLIPMVIGAALPSRRMALPRVIGGLEAAAVFLVVLVPYVVLRCGEFPLALLAGFVGGIALGAVAGGAAGMQLHRRPAWASPTSAGVP